MPDHADRPAVPAISLAHCDAPCVHYITKADYGARVRQALDILEGRDSGISRSLQQEMEDAAESMEFEKAAMYRDQIKAIAVIQEQQNIVNTAGGDMDVIGLARQAGQTCVQIYTVRMGKLMGRETFSLDNSSDEEEGALMNAVLDQYYSDGTFIPTEVVVPAMEDGESCERRLSEQKGKKVTVTVPQRGTKKQLLTMACENAAASWNRSASSGSTTSTRRREPSKAWRGSSTCPIFERMECFDISHTQGSQTVASMVVFEHGQPAKKEYRRFKLKTVQGKPDDFKSMAEIMGRRYGEKDWPVPDSSSSTAARDSSTPPFPSSAMPVVKPRSSAWPSASKKSSSKAAASPSSSATIRRNCSSSNPSATKPTACHHLSP